MAQVDNGKKKFKLRTNISNKLSSREILLELKSFHEGLIKIQRDQESIRQESEESDEILNELGFDIRITKNYDYFSEHLKMILNREKHRYST